MHQSEMAQAGMPQSAMTQSAMPQSRMPGSEMQKSILPQYWYVVADTRELTRNTVLSRKVLDESLACYRDPRGQVVIAQDRCIHRSASLSSGTVSNGTLTCRYHGWNYGDSGKIVSIPCEGGEEFATKCGMRAKTYKSIEQDGYVYVCLAPGEHTPTRPLTLSDLGSVWKGRIRLQNRFQNSLSNCVENYIDVPHTAYVHHGIFRKPKGEPLRTSVTRCEGRIDITYHGERLNLGTFSSFLNPNGTEIEHTDHFFAPNVTSVHYKMPNGYRYSISSQSIPVSSMETMVYTDISYDFGIWTSLSTGIVRRQAEEVLRQDIDILNEQGRNIDKYGERFYTTSADLIHTLTSEVITAMTNGKAPADISAEAKEITFCV
jgi:phenylpropionate dioxygenase-like ring-hydroxylating dioxygenase large terminal subunit